LRAIDLDDATARQAADPERYVQTQRSRGDGLDIERCGGIAQSHDRTLAKLLFDLTQRGGKRFLAVVFHLRRFLEEWTGRARTGAPRISQPQLSHKQLAGG